MHQGQVNKKKDVTCEVKKPDSQGKKQACDVDRSAA